MRGRNNSAGSQLAQAQQNGARLKVENVEVFLIGAAWRNFTFVKISTDTGVVGWGEATLGWKETAVRELILDFGKRYVMGRSAFDIEDLWFKLYQIEHNTGPVMFSAMAGIEMALWDIVGKACGQPVYNLVGGRVRSKVKAYANGWYTSTQDLGYLTERAQDVKSRGYKALKFDPFGPGGREISKAELRQACKTVEAVRRAIGDDMEILLEFHGRFSPIMALEAIRAMQPYNPGWCEEPIPAHNNEAMAQVVAGSPLRVATGEHTYSRFGFLDLLQHRAAHVIQPDITYAGGFMEAKKISALAETYYVSVAPHNCDGPLKTIAGVHLAANIPNFMILETFEDFDVPWRKDLYRSNTRLNDGYYELSDDPGWGMEINEEAIAAHPEDPAAKLNMFSDEWESKMCK
ncbi:MAG TPA: mandelate racemase/muconate lactonizing enzyme family protein [Candidatus Sulfotelmatobacter sp.]|nr:mandelate racemase/muconate lactonizing enzyme family protein [Candidatus Sulfotelmatobacter sp.]